MEFFSLSFDLFEFVTQGIREQFVKNVHYFTVLHTPTTATGEIVTFSWKSRCSMKERVKQSVHRPSRGMDVEEDSRSGEKQGQTVKTDLAVRTDQAYQIYPCGVGDAHLGRLFGHFKADPVFTSYFRSQFTCPHLTGFCVAGILPTWRGTKTRGCSSATCSVVILPPLPSPQVSTKSAPRSVPSASPPFHKRKKSSEI